MSNRFMLTGGDQADLKKYINSQVEIRGTLHGGNRMGSGTGASATGSGTGSGSGTGTGSGSGSGTGSGSSASGTGSQSGMQAAPTLRVTSVKQIAPSCSSENR
ncbi:MAG TPA: hypothetical protein VM493_05095 [Vicinamibacterales bacterium]|nr:hypothetical protein [Vicinamibacterales bacterium]